MDKEIKNFKLDFGSEIKNFKLDFGSKGENKLEFITTPFPYLHNAMHLGNAYQLIRGNLITKFRNCFYTHGYYDRETVFPYLGFHCTGIPISVKIDELKANCKGQLFNSKLVREALVEKNLEHLVPFCPKSAKLKDLDLKSWCKMLQAYYDKVLKEQKVDLENKKYYFTTQDLDDNYHSFVNHIYNKLEKEKVIKVAVNYVIKCDKCDNIIGDHDRKDLEGWGINWLSAKTFRNQNKIIYLARETVSDPSSSDLKFYSFFRNGINYLVEESLICRINISINGALEKEARKEKKQDYACNIALVDNLNRMVNFEFFYQNLSPVKVEIDDVFEKKDQQIAYINKGIQCKCNGYAKIDKENTCFVDFELPLWKQKVKEKILSINLPKSLEKELLLSSEKLKKVAFLRTKGYGSRLDILKHTSFKNHIVDSLMDSPLFYYYSAYWYEHQKFDKHSFDKYMKSCKIIAHSTGKDLTRTHVLYSIYFLALLYPETEVPFFISDGHIIDKNRQKFSKTKGNVIYYETEIAGKTYYPDLNFYLSNLNDQEEDKLVNIEEMNQVCKKDTFKLNELKQSIRDMSTKDPFFNSELVKEILLKVANTLKLPYIYLPNEKVGICTSSSQKLDYFRIRLIKQLLIYDLNNALKKYLLLKSKEEPRELLESPSPNKALLGDLLNVYLVN